MKKITKYLIAIISAVIVLNLSRNIGKYLSNNSASSSHVFKIEPNEALLQKQIREKTEADLFLNQFFSSTENNEQRVRVALKATTFGLWHLEDRDFVKINYYFSKAQIKEPRLCPITKKDDPNNTTEDEFTDFLEVASKFSDSEISEISDLIVKSRKIAVSKIVALNGKKPILTEVTYSSNFGKEDLEKVRLKLNHENQKKWDKIVDLIKKSNGRSHIGRDNECWLMAIIGFHAPEIDLRLGTSLARQFTAIKKQDIN